MTGKVKKFHKEKGFGFIEVEGNKKDIFFHFSDILMEGFKIIDEGADVEFELKEEEKGLKAYKVKKI